MKILALIVGLLSSAAALGFNYSGTVTHFGNSTIYNGTDGWFRANTIGNTTYVSGGSYNYFDLY